MPDQSWTCPACRTRNPPYSEACRDCGTLAPAPSASDATLSATPGASPAPAGQQPANRQDFGASPVADDLSPARRSDESPSERFFASRKSPLARSRIFALLGLVVALAVAILKQGGLSSGTLVSVAILLLFALPIARYFRAQLRFGQPLVILSDEAIEAPNLAANEKRLRWTDIDSISFNLNHAGGLLTFHLKAVDGVRDVRKSWSGINPAKPTLALPAFSAADQESLLDAVRRRHRRAVGGSDAQQATIGGQAAQPNELRERREFQERIKALQPRTWLTPALIAANLVIWLATLLAGAEFLRTPAVNLLAWGGNAASEVQKGEWWRMLTATFLHGGFIHLAMNMLGLYSAGTFVERIYGPRLLLIIYLGSGLFGSALSLHFAARQAVSVGASGAVFGVAGALLVAVFQHRDKLPKSFSKQTLAGMSFFAFYSLLQGFGKGGIDNAAHVGGLLAGCLTAFILPERFDLDHYRRNVTRRALVALVVLALATASLAAMAPLATVDQGRIAASAPILDRALKGFDSAMKSLRADQKEVADGRLSEGDAEHRSRSVHAQSFRRVADDFAQLSFRTGDPRQPFIKDLQRIAELITESLAMASVVDAASGKIAPADPARMAEIESELRLVGERVTRFRADGPRSPGVPAN